VTVNIALFDNLDAVAADAAGALDRAAQPCLFRRLDWYRLLTAHCPPDGKLMVVRAADGDARAWLFLARRSAAARSYANWYSLRAGPSAIGTGAPSLAPALRKQGLSTIEIGPDEQDRIADLAREFRAAGWRVSLREDKANWVAEVAGMDFEAYWAARPARLRNTFKRKAKAAKLEVAIHDAFSAEAWADYEAVYRASWKPEEGSFPFLRALAEEEGAAGTLRLGIAKQDGVPVAAQLWLVEGGTATIHKLAYAEAAKSLSPGTILGEAMFRRAIDTDRVRVIDYGTGDDRYKKDWMAERRTLWQIDAFNPKSLRGLAGAARAWASALVGRARSG